jgi:arylsulfatase A-like enzyme
MEGGMRVPGIFWWPGTLKPLKVENSMASTMDLLPTIAHLVGAELPKVKLDGHNISDLLSGNSTESPYDVFYYYQLEQLQAVRKGDWKLHLPLDSMYNNFHRASIVEGRPMALYNLKEDISESNNLAEHYPEVVAELTDEADKAQMELGDFGRSGAGVRPAAIVTDPVPQLMK